MGIFGDLMGKIFHHANVEPPPEVWKGSVPQPQVQNASVAQPVPGAPATVAFPATTGTAVQQQVDIASVLDGLAAKNKEKLDWKHSIVDLMKLVGIDSSLAARRELADDLKYTGDKNDTATMNMWLHKEVMKRLAEHGGTVPPELLSH